jgi:hypothetical protein
MILLIRLNLSMKNSQRIIEELIEIDLKKIQAKLIKEKEKQMSDAVKVLDFETAAFCVMK